MLDILSKIDLQWLLGIFFALFLLHLRKTSKQDFLKQQTHTEQMERVFSRILKAEQDSKVFAVEQKNFKEKLVGLQAECNFLKAEISKEVYAIEVKLYKVRGEQNTILEKLDSKIENIYQLLTKRDV